MGWATCTDGHVHWGPRGAAGLLLARDGRVLMQLRASWAHQGGTWSIPGGAVERRESPTEAALREATEELGLDHRVMTVRGTSVATCGGWSYETVLAEADGEVRVRDLAESAGHAWVPAAEVTTLRLHPSFRAAWEHPASTLRPFVEGTAPGPASADELEPHQPPVDVGLDQTDADVVPQRQP